MRVGKPCRRLPVESRGSVRAEFLDKLVGLVVGLSSPVLGVASSSPASVSLSLSQIYNIKAKYALKHPNWSMGKKISIDSATMMNKIFEVIEAVKIFDLSIKKFDFFSNNVFLIFFYLKTPPFPHLDQNVKLGQNDHMAVLVVLHAS